MALYNTVFVCTCLQKKFPGRFSCVYSLCTCSLYIQNRVIRCQMGRRKSKRKPPPKKKMTGNLDTQFTCPFCNHEKSCDVKMERSRNTGIISCTVCLEEFQTPITYLSEPVDVYSDWIDACEAANQ
ncbi:transcription elongation factor 1 homolog isoform X2 [Ictalurus furcatus]|uniref:transcription elongation factor 1 homolog isoform X2 n=1 Tax=Ictalurus furcatus TaxID=66913 RepID=UPI002350C849|nr:transcription elongation factor 1 homolog isoform X2 [Ictalurus furcatus]